jgi:hypothetical protein
MAAALLRAMHSTVTQDANQGYGDRDSGNIRFAQIAIRFVQRVNSMEMMGGSRRAVAASKQPSSRSYGWFENVDIGLRQNAKFLAKTGIGTACLTRNQEGDRRDNAKAYP